jgi:hypothetical protein
LHGWLLFTKVVLKRNIVGMAKQYPRGFQIAGVEIDIGDDEELYDVGQVAAKLHLPAGTVLSRAKTRGVGLKFSRIWLFTQEMVEVLEQEIPRGRPKRAAQESGRKPKQELDWMDQPAA